MEGILHYETFLLAGILLNLTPGNDTIFILSKSMAQGRRAGIISALGIGAGCLVHTLLAAFGLSLILAKSLLVFTVVKYLGAAYLLYLGWRMLMPSPVFAIHQPAPGNSASNRRVFIDAMLTNILNPKVAIFFIAFLPQFIDPAFRHAPLPFLLLGLSFITTGTIWCIFLAVFASAVARRLQKNPALATRINQFCGLALVGLGIKLAFARHPVS